MSEELVARLMSDAIMVMLKISLPVLLVGLVIGLVVGIFQATTQIQEQTLSFIPKMVAIFLVIMLMGQWMLVTLLEYTKGLFNLISSIK